MSQLTSDRRPRLAKSFISFWTANQAAAYLNITGIKLEYVTSTDIEVNRDAYFGDFPTAHFTLHGSETQEITLSGSPYTKIQWYFDGKEVSGETNATFTVSKGSLSIGEHSLAVVVTVNGQLYSKSVRFTVAD